MLSAATGNKSQSKAALFTNELSLEYLSQFLQDIASADIHVKQDDKDETCWVNETEMNIDHSPLKLITRLTVDESEDVSIHSLLYSAGIFFKKATESDIIKSGQGTRSVDEMMNDEGRIRCRHLVAKNEHIWRAPVQNACDWHQPISERKAKLQSTLRELDSAHLTADKRRVLHFTSNPNVVELIWERGFRINVHTGGMDGPGLFFSTKDLISDYGWPHENFAANVLSDIFGNGWQYMANRAGAHKYVCVCYILKDYAKPVTNRPSAVKISWECAKGLRPSYPGNEREVYVGKLNKINDCCEHEWIKAIFRLA